MKKVLILSSLILSTLQVTAQDLKTAKDSLSYAIGVDVASTFKNQNIDINPATFAAAVNAVLQDKSVMTAEQAGQYIRNHFMQLSMKVANENKAKGVAFLEKNKLESGVVALPSGLQYKIITPGNGVKPTATDQVTVHYTGKTLDGKVFDSSVTRGEPATFGLNQVIKGWTEALQLMPVGSKWIIYIPEDLAYGAQGPPAIGPNQTLVFEVELLNIVKE